MFVSGLFHAMFGGQCRATDFQDRRADHPAHVGVCCPQVQTESDGKLRLVRGSLEVWLHEQNIDTVAPQPVD